MSSRENELKKALEWCSGSDDFQDGGKAREGWLKICVPLLQNAPVEDKLNLTEELGLLLNRLSREEDSNTPDFILAEYLMACLGAFEVASNRREVWYGVEHVPGEKQVN